MRESGRFSILTTDYGKSDVERKNGTIRMAAPGKGKGTQQQENSDKSAHLAASKGELAYSRAGMAAHSALRVKDVQEF
jgi:hypothetical protein